MREILNHTLLIALLIMATSVFGQRTKRVQILLGFTPAMSGELGFGENKRNQNEDILEGDVYVPGGQFLIDMAGTRVVGMVLGVEFRQYGFKFTRDHSTSIYQGPGLEPLIIPQEQVNRYYQANLVLPFLFRVSVFEKNRSDISLRLGFETHLSLYKRNTVTIYTDGEGEEVWNNFDWYAFEQFGFGGAFGAVYSFGLTKNSDLQLYVAPQFDMVLMYHPEYWTDKFPYRVSLSVGVAF